MWTFFHHNNPFCNVCTLNCEIDEAAYRIQNYHSIACRKIIYLPAIAGGMSSFPDSDEYLYAVIPGWPGAKEEQKKIHRYFHLLLMWHFLLIH